MDSSGIQHSIQYVRKILAQSGLVQGMEGPAVVSTAVGGVMLFVGGARRWLRWHCSWIRTLGDTV